MPQPSSWETAPGHRPTSTDALNKLQRMTINLVNAWKTEKGKRVTPTARESLRTEVRLLCHDIRQDL